MKKILLFCLIALFSSCIDFNSWKNETFSDDNECAQGYIDMMYEAVKDDDLQDFIHINLNAIEWCDESKSHEKALKEVTRKDSYKIEVIEEYAKMHKDKLPW